MEKKSWHLITRDYTKVAGVFLLEPPAFVSILAHSLCLLLLFISVDKKLISWYNASSRTASAKFSHGETLRDLLNRPGANRSSTGSTDYNGHSLGSRSGLLQLHGVVGRWQRLALVPCRKLGPQVTISRLY